MLKLVNSTKICQEIQTLSNHTPTTEVLVIIDVHWLLFWSHLSGWFWYFTQNFGMVMDTYKCCLPFCECRWGGGSIWRWLDTSTLHLVIKLVSRFCTWRCHFILHECTWVLLLFGDSGDTSTLVQRVRMVQRLMRRRKR